MARRLKILITDSQPWCPQRQLWAGEALDLPHLVQQLEATYSLVGVIVENWDEEFDEWCGPYALADLPDKARVRIRAAGRVAMAATNGAVGQSVQQSGTMVAPELAQIVTAPVPHGDSGQLPAGDPRALLDGAGPGVSAAVGLSTALTQALDDSYFAPSPSTGPRGVDGLLMEGTFAVSTQPPSLSGISSSGSVEKFDEVISRRNGRSFWRRGLRHRLNANDGSCSFTLSHSSILVKQRRDGRAPAVEWEYASIVSIARINLTMFQISCRADSTMVAASVHAVPGRKKTDGTVATAAQRNGIALARQLQVHAMVIEPEPISGVETFEFWATAGTVQTIVVRLATLLEERHYTKLPSGLALAQVRKWKEQTQHLRCATASTAAPQQGNVIEGDAWIEEAVYASHSAVHMDIASFHRSCVPLRQVWSELLQLLYLKLHK